MLFHEYPTPASPPAPSYFDNTPDINIVHNMVHVNVDILNILLVVKKYDMNFCSYVIITRNKVDETSELFLPYDDGSGTYTPNKILVDTNDASDVVPFKLSCAAISVNNVVNGLHNRYRFYNIMSRYHNGTLLGNYARDQLAIVNAEYPNLDLKNILYVFFQIA